MMTMALLATKTKKISTLRTESELKIEPDPFELYFISYTSWHKSTKGFIILMNMKNGRIIMRNIIKVSAVATSTPFPLSVYRPNHWGYSPV